VRRNGKVGKSGLSKKEKWNKRKEVLDEKV